MLEGIQQVQLELSNRCSYAHLHPKCPASCAGTVRYLPTETVDKVLDYLIRKNYTGEIMFSIYNEPLEDPRLTIFLCRVRVEFDGATAYVITNGRCLDQYMLTKLTQGYGARVIANGYTPEEAARLRTLEAPHYKVREAILDNRMKMYDRPRADLQAPCYAPGRNVTVWHTGEVGICCRDWRRSAVMGDLNQQSLEEILNSPGRAALIRRLRVGDRSGLDVCRRCKRLWRS